MRPVDRVDNSHGEDEDYDSADDQDFNPNEEGRDGSSSDEDADSDTGGNESMRKGPASDFTPQKGKTSHRENSKMSDEEGGEGGLIKTRAQRRAQMQERKPLVQASGASVDVDSMWAQMQTDSSRPTTTTATTTAISGEQSSAGSSQDTRPLHADAGTVVIKRTFEFAGQVVEEEKLVKASSAEAKLYQEQQTNLEKSRITQQSKPATSAPVRRPVKRKSMFATDSTQSASKGPKLNTLQKSKLDWAAHVDKEGIANELNEYQRAKDSYTGRMDFLNRMDEKREQQQSPR